MNSEHVLDEQSKKVDIIIHTGHTGMCVLIIVNTEAKANRSAHAPMASRALSVRYVDRVAPGV